MRKRRAPRPSRPGPPCRRPPGRPQRKREHKTPAPAPAPEKALEDMTVTELRSYAAAHGIDVTGAAKKQDLLLAVQTAVEPSAAPAEAVPGEQPETAAE